MRGPAGPGDAGQRPFDAGLVSNLFPRACITRTLKPNDQNQYYRSAVWFVRSLPDAGPLQKVSRSTLPGRR